MLTFGLQAFGAGFRDVDGRFLRIVQGRYAFFGHYPSDQKGEIAP